MLRERYWLVFILLQHDTSMFGLSGSPKLGQGQPRGHFGCIFFYHCVQRFKYNKKRIIQSHYQAMPILELGEKIRLRFVAEAQLEPAP